MIGQDVLGLSDLISDGRLQLRVGSHITHLAVALHFDQPTCHHTACWVEVEQGKVSPTEADFIAHFLSALLQRLVQLQVRVQRHDDLVLENALVFEEQTRERQAHRLGPLG